MEQESLAQLLHLLPATLIELNVAGYTEYLTDFHVEQLCDRCPAVSRKFNHHSFIRRKCNFVSDSHFDSFRRAEFVRNTMVIL